MIVSIVIPNWNGEEKLKRNLPKVLKVKNVLEVIVVDDGSTDGSVQAIKEQFPEVKLIIQPENHGFSTTCNVGVKNAEGEFIFLLNTDAVPDEDCLTFIKPNFEDERVFSVGCNTGGSWSWAKFKNGFFWHYMSEEKVEKVHETLWSSGGSAVFKREIWNQLGGFDEMFNRFYEEDLDLGYRATKRGFINLWEPKAKVEHYKEPGVIEQNFSKSFVSKTAQRNQLLFTWKNITDPDLTRQHIMGLIKMLLTHPKYWGIFLAALVNLPQVLEKRKVEKREQKVSDREILGKYNP